MTNTKKALRALIRDLKSELETTNSEFSSADVKEIDLNTDVLARLFDARKEIKRLRAEKERADLQSELAAATTLRTHAQEMLDAALADAD